MIVIVFGLPGSGKSYFASRLAGMINAQYINSDRIRKEMLKERTYTIKEKLSVYDEMLSRFIEVDRQNKNVVLDATFYKNEIRRNFVHCEALFARVSSSTACVVPVLHTE